MPDEKVWNELFAQGYERCYPARSVMLYQGERGAYLLQLTSGLAKVVLRAEDGTERLLAHRGPGDLLGDMSAFSGKPRNADVIAFTPCRAIVIDKDSFLYFVRKRDLVTDLLRRELARRHESEVMRSELRNSPLVVRLARLLVMAVESSASQELNGWRQEDLAPSVDAGRRALSEALKVMRTERAVEVRPMGIRVSNLNALRNLARQTSD